jgi:hypothetical protein
MRPASMLLVFARADAQVDERRLSTPRETRAHLKISGGVAKSGDFAAQLQIDDDGRRRKKGDWSVCFFFL